MRGKDAGSSHAVRFLNGHRIGDAAIALVSFWVVALVARSRTWVLQPSAGQVALFATVGVVITVSAKRVATDMLGWWTYAERMPTLPLLGTGLLPLLHNG